MQRRNQSWMVLAAACAGVLGFAPVHADAASVTWDNGGGDQLWSNATNWAPDGAVDGNDAKFGATGSTTSNSTVTNIVDANRSVLSLGYNQFGASAATTQYHITQINDGKTLTLNGGTNAANGSTLYVGSAQAAPTTTDFTYTFIQNQPGAVSGGTLSIQNALADLTVRSTSNVTTQHMSTLDMSKLSFFNATMRDIKVGVGDSTNTRAEGTLYLANGNIIDCNSIQVGFNNSGTTGNPAARLYFGSTNTINTNSILVGGRATGNSAAGFTPGLTGAQLTIRGAGGVGRSDLSIGTQPVGDTGVATSSNANVMDLTGPTGFGSGSIDAQVNTLAIGRAGATLSTARQGAGTLTYNAGVIDANTVVIGDDNGTTTNSVATGILNIRANAQFVANNSVMLAKRTGTGTATSYSGTISIDGTGSGATPAKARVQSAITDGGGVSTINILNGGTLQARGLGSSTNPIDTVALNSGQITVDIGGTTPVTPWGFVTALNADGANTIGLQYSGSISTGTIPAIQYGAIGGAGGFASFTAAKQPARVVAHLNNNTGTNTIEIVIDSTNQPRWNGALSNATTAANWDVNNAGNQNWVLVGTNAGTFSNYQEDLVTYSTTDTVLFDDQASGTTNVNVASTVLPNGVTVNNSTKPYTFGGTGKISGVTGITKQGTNTLTFANTGGNDFSGTLDIQNGTVNTSANDLLPNSGAITVESGGTFDLGARTETIGTLNLSGGVSKQTSGVLTVGTINQTSGSLTAGSGAINANIVSISGGTMTAGSGSISTSVLNVSGGVTVSPGSGSIAAPTINLNDGTLPAGAITTSTVNAINGQIDLQLTGATTLNINGTTSTTVAVTGSNSFSGPTTINGGKLLISNNTALGDATGNTRILGAAATANSVLALTNNITSAEPILFHGRNGIDNVTPNNNPHILNQSGNNTLSGAITIESGGLNYTIQSDAGKLTLSGNFLNPINSTPAKQRDLHLRGAGDGEFSGNIQNSGSDTTSIVKQDAGTWTLSGTGGAVVPTSVQGGTLVYAAAANTASTLDVQSGAVARVAASGGNKVLTVNSLTFTTPGKLDLTDNKLIDKTDGVATVNGYIATGRNGGAWTGTGGIVTSQTQAAAGSLTTLGVAAGSQVKGIAATATATWAGQTVSGTDTLVMYTYGGDANLDGKINVDDYTRIDFNVPLGVSGWYNGDFNYDGKINVDDYTIIDFNVGIQGAAFPTASGGGLGGVSAVPEPSMLSLLVVPALMIKRRQRRGAARR